MSRRSLVPIKLCVKDMVGPARFELATSGLDAHVFEDASAPGSPRLNERSGILLATFRCLDQVVRMLPLDYERSRPLDDGPTAW